MKVPVQTAINVHHFFSTALPALFLANPAAEQAAPFSKLPRLIEAVSDVGYPQRPQAWISSLDPSYPDFPN
jgi:hypothetical protein